MQQVIVLLLVLLSSLILGERIPRVQHFAKIGAFNLEPPGELGYNNSRLRAGQTGLTPLLIKKAYGLSTSLTVGSGKTIAVVDAFGCSNLENDLNEFSKQYNLPACTTANGCLKKVSQTGSSILPPDDTDDEPNWGYESVMDVSIVHAICPGCKILYIAAKSTSMTDMLAAVKYGAANADYVSMSFGSEESQGIQTYERTFAQYYPKVSFFASSGDDGSAGGTIYPASSLYVVAVGGTNIVFNGDTVVENGWTGSGGGCSSITPVTNDQKGKSGFGCNTFKSIPDVSALADPATGLVGYYSKYCKPSCWSQMGGTSLAAPLVAAMTAIKPPPTGTNALNYFYSLPGTSFRDIISGSNGGYACTSGLDLVTGLGSWKQS
jgi:subtilase family serine protease